MAILNFIGNIINGLYEWTTSLPITIIFYTFLAFILSVPLTKKANENILLSSYMKVELKEIRKADKNNPGKMTSDLSKMFQKYDYTVFASTMSSVMQMIFGMLLILAFIRSEPLKGIDGVVLGVDLRVAPSAFLGNRGPASFAPKLICIFSLGLQYVHDLIMQQDLISDMKLTDTITLFVIAAILIFTPVLLSVYWFIHEVIDICYLFIVVHTEKELIKKKVHIYNEREKNKK